MEVALVRGDVIASFFIVTATIGSNIHIVHIHQHRTIEVLGNIEFRRSALKLFHRRHDDPISIQKDPSIFQAALEGVFGGHNCIGCTASAKIFARSTHLSSDMFDFPTNR
jgi:hypothetical protein